MTMSRGVKPPPWTAEERSYLRATLGTPAKIVAKRLGRTRRAVNVMRRKLGLSRPQPRKQIDRPALLDCHGRGLSDEQAADALGGVSARTVARVRGELGLPPNGWTDRSNAIRARTWRRTGGDPATRARKAAPREATGPTMAELEALIAERMKCLPKWWRHERGDA